MRELPAARALSAGRYSPADYRLGNTGSVLDIPHRACYVLDMNALPAAGSRGPAPAVSRKRFRIVATAHAVAFAVLLAAGNVTTCGADVEKVLFFDDFTGSTVSEARWHLPTWVSPEDGTYVGRTQFRCSQNAALPTISSGAANITLQTYNPTGNSFYGYDLISNPSFMPGDGLIVTIVATLGPSVPGGTVSGIFLYGLQPGSGTLHDEIDFEIISNDKTKFNTNIYGNEPLGAGHPVACAYKTGSAATVHTYQIEWTSNRVAWSVDGAVVRTVTTESPIPAGPMHVHLNMWAPDFTWPDAYNAALNYTTVSSQNKKYQTCVESVSVEQVQRSVLASIRVTPVACTLTVGDPVSGSKSLSARPVDQAGKLFPATLTWLSDNPDVAAVDENGNVRAVSKGTARITASSGGVTGNVVTVTVLPQVVPAVAFETVARYGRSGYVTGVVTGMKATSYKNYRIQVFIHVNGGWWTKPYFNNPATAIDSVGEFSANIDTGGMDQDATEIRAYLAPANVSFRCAGDATLPAGLSGYAYADVIRDPPPAGIKTIVLDPQSATLAINGSRLFTATALDKNNLPLDAMFMWLSSNPKVATVDQSGNVAAVAKGSATICAISGTFAKTVPIVVK